MKIIINNPEDCAFYELLPFEISNLDNCTIEEFNGSNERSKVLVKDGKTFLQAALWAKNPEQIKVTIKLDFRPMDSTLVYPGMPIEPDKRPT